MENARLARLAAEARKSSVFFRLQLKAAPKATVTAEGRADPVPRKAPAAPDGGLATLSALRAADRALALAGGDADLIGATISAADQTRKLTFLKSGPEKEVYNPHALQTPASPYQLMAGTVIAASLVTGLNSDLPGFVIAQVTEHVYDTVSGRFLLIPQGSRLVGRYDNVVAFGQERALVVWFSTWHYAANRDLGALQRLGGWKSVKMVLRYAHVNVGELAHTIDRLPSKGGPDTESAQPECVTEKSA